MFRELKIIVMEDCSLGSYGLLNENIKPRKNFPRESTFILNGHKL